MFEDFRRAWRQAVDNFWRELDGDGDAAAASVYREVGRARNQLERLESEIGECTLRVAEEREQARVCDRRERLARDIGDEETARIAAEFSARHRERAVVLERKREALESERALCRRDLTEMERALQEGRVAPSEQIDDLNRHPSEPEFQHLEESSRERAAQERLDEIKRRMGR